MRMTIFVMAMDGLKKHRHIIIAAVFFALVYGLISFVNHYCFRTYALDLGAYTNALWDYARLQWNDSSVFLSLQENLLADHFDIYLIIFSPFSYLFGSYTLLVFQLLFVVAGGIGVYRYFMMDVSISRYALPASIYYYLFFGVLSAVSFDYHSNTIAASLLPWLFVFIRGRKIVASVIMLMAILIAKENVSLWLVFVLLGLTIEYRKNAQWRKLLLAGSGISMAYFITVTFIVMPAISNTDAYHHFHYSFLGESPSEALVFLVTHPIESIQAFFINHTEDLDGNFVKLEFLVLLFVSGLYILFRKPAYLLMLVPLFIQKFFHDNISMWGFSDQYAVEFAPVMAIGIFSSIAAMKSKILKKMLIVLSLVGCLIASIRIMDNTVMFTDKSRIRIYKAAHYQRDYDVSGVYDAFKKIPDDAVVSAQSPFVPHLALRDNIYQFPIVRDAEYVVISLNELPYPLSKEAFSVKTSELINSQSWTQIYSEDGLIILQKSSTPN